jgi:hypothetical protein
LLVVAATIYRNNAPSEAQFRAPIDALLKLLPGDGG